MHKKEELETHCPTVVPLIIFLRFFLSCHKLSEPWPLLFMEGPSMHLPSFPQPSNLPLNIYTTKLSPTLPNPTSMSEFHPESSAIKWRRRDLPEYWTPCCKCPLVLSEWQYLLEYIFFSFMEKVSTLFKNISVFTWNRKRRWFYI